MHRHHLGTSQSCVSLPQHTNILKRVMVACNRLNSREPPKIYAFEAGGQIGKATICDALGTWIPFGDHPLKLERYRED